MEFIFGKAFERELKKLKKKYLSLENDLDVFCETLELDPMGQELLSNHIVQISGLGENTQGKFYKVRRFVCKSISGNSSNSGIRIIYRYQENTHHIHFEQVQFVEIFHKNEKSNHNIERIRNISD